MNVFRNPGMGDTLPDILGSSPTDVSAFNAAAASISGQSATDFINQLAAEGYTLSPGGTPSNSLTAWLAANWGYIAIGAFLALVFVDAGPRRYGP